MQRTIEAQERIIQTTTELKKALMHKLFTEGLRDEPQKQTEIGPVPESWEVGPVLSVVETSWDFIDTHLTEADYRNLGGPFRLVIEDFLKRTAAKLELKVKFKPGGSYTGGDFVNVGIQKRIRDELIRLDGADEADILTDVGRVFGQGNFINDLSHDNLGRLEISFDQAKDFVAGLKSLTKRCEDHKLIKGR